MSQASAVSSRQSFASEYSYHDSEGETPLKPVYNEETALAAALTRAADVAANTVRSTAAAGLPMTAVSLGVSG